MKTGDRDPLGTLQKSCKYHTKRKRVGTTFAGQNLPGSPWHPAKVLQMPHKTEKGRNNICGSKFAGIPLAPGKSPANATQNGKGQEQHLRVKICRDPLGTLQKSCKYHTKRKRVGTTFAGQNLPGSPWHPAKVLQIPHKTERVGTTFAGQNLPGSPWHPAKVLQIPHKTEKGRNNICGSKFAGIPLAPCKSPANTTQNEKG